MTSPLTYISETDASENREINMKADVVRLAAIILVAAASAAHAASETIIMNSIDANGVGKKFGTLDLSDTKEGLRVVPRLTDLPPGDHGFHVHVNPDCGPGGGPNGQPAAGMAAGGHYDPANTGKHLGPQGEGHKATCRYSPSRPAGKLPRLLQYHTSHWPTPKGAQS
jgi:Cu/Zn superoxide dismutase